MINSVSDRLSYRPLIEEDWPFFLMLNQDPVVMKYVADPRSEQTIRTQSFDIRLPTWHPGSTHWLCLMMLERQTQARIGVTGFIPRGDGIAEVGFLLAPDFYGRGYGAESLKHICAFAFDVCGFHTLTATVTAGNIASKNTLLSAGFAHERTLSQAFFLQGKWQDDWCFSLSRNTFFARAAQNPPGHL